ncbi:Uncharacterised protein [uncultured archaeon]|nr:Uncharacterised protein [uncultured archaeon]
MTECVVCSNPATNYLIKSGDSLCARCVKNFRTLVRINGGHVDMSRTGLLERLKKMAHPVKFRTVRRWKANPVVVANPEDVRKTLKKTGRSVLGRISKELREISPNRPCVVCEKSTNVYFEGKPYCSKHMEDIRKKISKQHGLNPIKVNGREEPKMYLDEGQAREIYEQMKADDPDRIGNFEEWKRSEKDIYTFEVPPSNNPTGPKSRFDHHRQIPPQCFQTISWATVPIEHTPYKGKYRVKGALAVTGRLKKKCADRWGERGVRVWRRAWAIQSIMTPKSAGMRTTKGEMALENPGFKPTLMAKTIIKKFGTSFREMEDWMSSHGMSNKSVAKVFKNPKKGAKKTYRMEDFDVMGPDEINDPRIAYIFMSKDGQVSGNLFWEEGKQPHVRGLVGETGTIEYKYPMNAPATIPKDPVSYLEDFVKRINRGLYENPSAKDIEKEAKEHPWLTKSEARRVAEDHERLGVKNPEEKDFTKPFWTRKVTKLSIRTVGFQDLLREDGRFLYITLDDGSVYNFIVSDPNLTVKQLAQYKGQPYGEIYKFINSSEKFHTKHNPHVILHETELPNPADDPTVYYGGGPEG